MRTSAGGYTPYQRATTVAQRLGDALAAGLRPEDIHFAQWGNEAVILAGNNLLLTADSDHARFNNTTPLALANDWATNLAGVLGGHHGGRVQYNPGNDNHAGHGNDNGSHPSPHQR
jgi:hypothetical protein